MAFSHLGGGTDKGRGKKAMGAKLKVRDNISMVFFELTLPTSSLTFLKKMLEMLQRNCSFKLDKKSKDFLGSSRK